MLVAVVRLRSSLLQRQSVGHSHILKYVSYIRSEAVLMPNDTPLNR